MSLIARQQRIERRRALAGEWSASDARDKAENELFDASFRVAESARDFERAAGARGSAPAAAAALGCLTCALESQATAFIKLRSLLVHALQAEQEAVPEDGEELGRLLFAINQNLRFAVQASDLAREAAGRILDPSG